MDFSWQELGGASVASSAGTLLILKALSLFRKEVLDHKTDQGHAALIKSLREELDRRDAQMKVKDEMIDAKEQTISRLVREKAEQLEQLSEIPRLETEVKELKEQVAALAGLLDHFIRSGIGMNPEQQIHLVSLLANLPQKPQETSQ